MARMAKGGAGSSMGVKLPWRKYCRTVFRRSELWKFNGRVLVLGIRYLVFWHLFDSFRIAKTYNIQFQTICAVRFIYFSFHFVEFTSFFFKH